MAHLPLGRCFGNGLNGTIVSSLHFEAVALATLCGDQLFILQAPHVFMSYFHKRLEWPMLLHLLLKLLPQHQLLEIQWLPMERQECLSLSMVHGKSCCASCRVLSSSNLGNVIQCKQGDDTWSFLGTPGQCMCWWQRMPVPLTSSNVNHERTLGSMSFRDTRVHVTQDGISQELWVTFVHVRLGHVMSALQPGQIS